MAFEFKSKYLAEIKRDGVSDVPRGGKREGAGRRVGTKGKRRVAMEKAIEPVLAQFGEEVPNLFAGDGVGLLQLIYRDPRIPLSVRADAAYKAARYERPALAATLVKGEMADVSRLPPPDRRRRLAEMLAEIGAEPGAVER